MARNVQHFEAYRPLTGPVTGIRHVQAALSEAFGKAVLIPDADLRAIVLSRQELVTAQKIAFLRDRPPLRAASEVHRRVKFLADGHLGPPLAGWVPVETYAVEDPDLTHPEQPHCLAIGLADTGSYLPAADRADFIAYTARMHEVKWRLISQGRACPYVPLAYFSEPAPPLAVAMVSLLTEPRTATPVDLGQLSVTRMVHSPIY